MGSSTSSNKCVSTENVQLGAEEFSALLWASIGKDLMVYTRNCLSKAMQDKTFQFVKLRDGRIVTRQGLLLGDNSTQDIDSERVLDVKVFVQTHEQQALRLDYINSQRTFGNRNGPLNEIEELSPFNCIVPAIIECQQC